MSYPNSNLLPIDIYFIKENLTDRIVVKNIADMSMQEICVDVTDLVSDNASIDLVTGHKIYFTFNRLSKLSDPEVKEKALSKSYPNAMRILTDEVFHILHNYVTIPGSIYEIYMIELSDNTYITRHNLEYSVDGKTFEYGVIVNLFNSIINTIPSEQRLITYANTDFKSIGKMQTMKLTSYNVKEITQWIYSEIDMKKYIVDLRERRDNVTHSPNARMIVINNENKHYVITSDDVVISTDNKIFITSETIMKELFIPSPYGEYEWDFENGTVIRRNENITSYFHYDVIGTIARTSKIINSVEVFGNFEGIKISMAAECTDNEHYPKIYMDDNSSPLYDGYVNIPNKTDDGFKLLMNFSANSTTHKYVIKWSDSYSDTVVFDASKATLLTAAETAALS